MTGWLAITYWIIFTKPLGFRDDMILGKILSSTVKAEYNERILLNHKYVLKFKYWLGTHFSQFFKTKRICADLSLELNNFCNTAKKFSDEAIQRIICISKQRFNSSVTLNVWEMDSQF